METQCRTTSPLSKAPAAAAAGSAFGEGWAFIPMGALIVDFVLTIAVARLTWFGHLGRAVFAVMTIAFVGLVAMAKFEHVDGRVGAMLVSLLGAAVIGFTHIVSQGDMVAIRFVTTARQTGKFMGAPATKKNLEIRGIFMRRVVEGMVVEEWQAAGLLHKSTAIPARIA